MKDKLFSRLCTGTTHLITTNLDNDDAIHARFVEHIQNEFTGQRREFLNFTNGFLFDTIRELLYVRRHRSNPFVSLVENLDGLENGVVRRASRAFEIRPDAANRGGPAVAPGDPWPECEQ